jgi:Nucleotide-diphospho-sugar transferase
MKIVTAANGNYRRMLETSLRQNEARGYSVDVYDLDGGLGRGTRFDGRAAIQRAGYQGFLGRCPWKPALLLTTGLKQDTTWMDADAFAIRKFDYAFDGNFDVAFTARRIADRRLNLEGDILTGLVNAGVAFFKPTDAAREFLWQWAEQVGKEPSQSDQIALNRILIPDFKRNHENPEFNCLGARVNLMTTDEFNFHYYPQEPLPRTKIVHFRSGGQLGEAVKNWGSRKW